MGGLASARDVGLAVARDVYCETCQVIVHETDKRFRASPKSLQSGTKAAMLRLEILDGMCDYGKFSRYGDLASISTGDMTDACAYILPEVEEILDEELGVTPEAELRASLCLEKGKKTKKKKKKKKNLKNGYCESLWADDDHPDVRETPAMRHAREGKEWLAEKKQEEGVKSLPSGLMLKILEKGSGTIYPAREDQVEVHYHGTLTNGNMFDSSYERGTPATFEVGQVIKGWTEALQLMVRGDVWELYIPSDLAYGANGQGADIPGNAVLVFKVELLGIQGKDDDSTDAKQNENDPLGSTEAVESQEKKEL